ncbi:DNA primase [Streptomyces sp. WAC05374]|uniref:bifunctional DNA primase/polymerase n=1 Tax=Streptomyces sp. WAC05374 TaxID=2487420 RepID=UPI0010554D40|nr:bifunctional DNA primase/polymerase [Streptomyces sp. WAC05374]TDF38771.1 DNA primase [Streptomyces sp. WAC05374]TDF45547.1 DNA primase [Streptomyces sp. WAC05374]TDF56547.1 DNA primase [Streptomyces sp. WAC05374]
MAASDRRTATLALAHALSAAERGLAVIPLSPTKLPALPSPHRGAPAPVHCRGECGLPGHGVHDATTDPAAVRALFALAPWATGYGIACGRPPHHLIGVDLDTEPAVLRRLALERGFTVPATVTVLTPSGGRHLWLTGPPGVVVPNSAGRLAPGIDIRGAGGYLVGPGSVTARGAYRLVPGTATLAPAPCPPALLRLLAPPPPAPRRAAPAGTPRGEGLVRFVLAAHEGRRNTRLFWAACRAYENGIGDDLADALTDAAVHTGLTPQEARATIASAARLTAPRGAGGRRAR